MEVKEAFNIINQAALEELNKEREKISELVFQGKNEQARYAIDRSDEIQDILAALEKFKKQWEFTFPPFAPPPALEQHQIFVRTPPGQRTPQLKYRLPILQALIEMGGNAKTAAVIDRVGELMADVLNEEDKMSMGTRNEVHWRNRVRYERWSMVDEGLLRSQSQVGIWEITDKGHEYFVNWMK